MKIEIKPCPFCGGESGGFMIYWGLKLKKMAQGLEKYPLAENGITEDKIWEWAKTQPIFNHYYEINRRCGCMYCPMSSYLNFAYLYKYYPDNFQYWKTVFRDFFQPEVQR